MKKLFGRDKGKDQPLAPPPIQAAPVNTPIHQQFATRPSTAEDERWEVVEQQQHTPPPSGQVPSPPRSPSPYTVASSNRAPGPQTLRKKTPPVLGILQSLDPIQQSNGPGHVRSRSEERIVENGHREKEKGKGFWSRGGGDRDRERERMEMEAREREHQRRERRDDDELTRKIGFLTATASEDWTLVLDVCDHASSSKTAAKEAVRAIRRDLKHGEPSAQLAAARLWAIMLRNSSDVFITQCTSKKFLDTIEDLVTSSRISPVVRERVLDVLAAAAFASGSRKDSGFRGLWRRVKPKDKPDEGVPFDTEDAMFNPPLSGGRGGGYDDNTINVPPVVTYQDATPIVAETPPPPVSKPPRKHKTSESRVPGDNRHPPRERERERERRPPRIIPPDEDMRRLFQECVIGVGNARLLSDALAMATPDDLTTDPVIVEFHRKCVDSQELILTQIPWASAGAERSVAKAQQEREQARLNGNEDPTKPATTREEDLLGELLAANELLQETLKQYDDLKRVGEERQVEDNSRKETKLDSRQRQFMTEDGMLIADPAFGGGGGSSSRSRSPSPVPHNFSSPDPFAHSQTLAPPPPAPNGPRSPGMMRTPSPGHYETELANGVAGVYVGRGSIDDQGGYFRQQPAAPTFDEDEELDEEPVQPSAKALGKRKVVVEEAESGSEAGTNHFGGSEQDEDRLSDSDDEDTPSRLWQRTHHPVQHYVYDAVAERAQQRLQETQGGVLVNGVH
ncbi:hypothetical protein HMN09_01191700 [Mycena chlorophos]|uniref:VHS domain-containing protein n=1 Tax=Mycena chlorophos TaxID=658473 RepID=A0A8H6S671_MYCCL|nr:hypothetical protein HMN09_01191700 [Mycena chlorophos]